MMDDPEDITATKRKQAHSAPVNRPTDATPARHSPVVTQQRHDVTQVKPTRDEQVRHEGYAGPQPKKPVQPKRTKKQDLPDGPTYPYQNGFGDGYHDDPYEDPDVRRRRRLTEAQRPVTDREIVTTGEQLWYRNVQDERPDTSQSGRLSQSAMMVREMYEDGEFDQEVAVSRGSNISVLSLLVYDIYLRQGRGHATRSTCLSC